MRRWCGIIPACAGSTLALLKPFGHGRDHPRMCGEHKARDAYVAADRGSSPHVRGARHVVIVEHLRTGIIPACAGSTFRTPPRQTLPWDHPRMCGEHGGISGAVDVNWGSSPHVRGAHTACVVSARIKGIIPACAGSTSSGAPRASSARDHPRMCGEHPKLNVLL